MYRRNHYVPQFHLSNFTDLKGHFYVFDKLNKWEKSRLNYTSPSRICYQDDRYTMYFGEVKNRELERLTYGFFDDKHSKGFNTLKEETFTWTLELIAVLEEYIPLVYWRAPVSDDHFNEISKKKDFYKNTLLTATDENRNEIDLDSEKYEMMRNDINFRRAIVPILAYSSSVLSIRNGRRDLEYRVVDWNIEQSPSVINDNPIIFSNKLNRIDDFNEELIFPLTSYRSIIRIEEKKIKSITFTKFLQDLQLFIQAKQYVICSDKDYLLELKKEYDVFLRLGLDKEVRKWIFT